MKAVRVAPTIARLRGTPAGRTLWRVVDGLVEIQVVDRALALAAQIFTSVLPVIIAASVFSGWHTAADVISDQFGFDTRTLELGDAATSSDPSLAAFGVAGFVMVVLSGTSFARALGRVYGAAWQVPSMGPRDAWRWLATLLAVALAVGLVGQTRDLAGLDYAGRPLALLGETAIWTLVWTLVPFLLTKGALSGRVLWATGLLSAAGLTVVHVAGRIVLPRTTASAQQHFGPLGLAFTSVSWLFVMSVVIVGAASVVGALAADESAIGRFLRGPDRIDGTPAQG
ncbi:hypothetical protein AB0H76_13160 [Nocardia sp. NPDC050712]|uniref:hypothetical protein n=1 Tax=Nocardia sp. NPDC050712 TaxID=3155518 RepID=UPI0033DE2BB1